MHLCMCSYGTCRSSPTLMSAPAPPCMEYVRAGTLHCSTPLLRGSCVMHHSTKARNPPHPEMRHVPITSNNLQTAQNTCKSYIVVKQGWNSHVLGRTRYIHTCAL